MRKRPAAVVAALAVLGVWTASSQTQETKRHINLPSRPVQAPFSDGVLVGQTLYLGADRTRPQDRPAA